MRTITLRVADALGEWIARGSATMMLQEDELYYKDGHHCSLAQWAQLYYDQK